MIDIVSAATSAALKVGEFVFAFVTVIVPFVL
jgi:hypothetical protein